MQPKGLKSYRIKDHARLQMGRRQITEDHVRQVLTSPQQVIEQRPGRRVYQSKVKLPARDKDYLIRVVVDVDRTPPEVVTVYRTSKIAKYWREES